MTDANHERVNDFLRSLEKALGGPGRRSEGILGEVRADLEAHVKRYQAEGQSEDEAVEHALDEMGNPYELAHHVRQEIPPFEGEVLTTIRYVAACGVNLWTLLMLWHFRAGSYGHSGPLVSGAVMLLHLPVILLIWPRIVWRKNWLFGLIPAGLALLLFIFMNSAGVKNEELMSVRIRETEEEVAALRAGNPETAGRTCRFRVFEDHAGPDLCGVGGGGHHPADGDAATFSAPRCRSRHASRSGVR